MKPVSWTVWGLGTTLVYLHDDRIEVGVLTTGYSEELRRVAYRDATSLVTWRTARPRLLVFGWTLVACGVGGAIGVALGLPTPVLVAVSIDLLLAAFLLYAGRDGTVLQFRVDSPLQSVAGVMTGGRAKQERFVADLVARIEERQRA